MYDESVLAALGAAACVLGVIGLVWAVLQIVAYWKVFTKAGEAGWKSIIPFYNFYVQISLCAPTMLFWIWLGSWLVSVCLNMFGGNAFVSILSFCVSIVMLAATVLANIKLSKAFGHGIGFAVGLTLLQPIFLMILGFGSSQYDPSIDKETWY